VSIPRQIRTRAVEALISFIAADGDFGPMVTGRIFRYAYDDMHAGISMAPKPRQAHVYQGSSVKSPGTGGAWDREFEIVVEWYSPRNEPPAALGAVSIDDEIDELVNRIYVGQSPSPGRFMDPDNPARYITLGVKQIRVTGPEVLANEAAVRRVLSIIFTTREDAQGDRL
jgi:hypothetical protein